MLGEVQNAPLEPTPTVENALGANRFHTATQIIAELVPPYLPDTAPANGYDNRR